MFGLVTSLIKDVGGIAGARFLRNAFVPCLAFWALLIYVVGIASESHLSRTLRIWEETEPAKYAIRLIGFSAVVLISAVFVSNQTTPMIQFSEGYWPKVLAWPWRAGQQWHIRKLLELDSLSEARARRGNLTLMERDAAEEPIRTAREARDPEEIIYRSYPPADRLPLVMPTRVGNIIRGAETYPKTRYGIDAVLIWPRLLTAVSDSAGTLLVETRSGLEQFLILSTLGVAFSAVAGVVLVWLGAIWWLFTIAVGGGFLFAWLMYRVAIGQALLYGEQIRTTFDLYRHDLIKALALPVPETIANERDLWEKISQFTFRGRLALPDWTDAEPPPKKPQPPAPTYVYWCPCPDPPPVSPTPSPAPMTPEAG